jgi:hypothetical protein
VIFFNHLLIMIKIPKKSSDFVHLFPAYCHPIIDSAGINLIRLNNTANKRHRRITENVSLHHVHHERHGMTEAYIIPPIPPPIP